MDPNQNPPINPIQGLEPNNNVPPPPTGNIIGNSLPNITVQPNVAPAVQPLNQNPGQQTPGQVPQQPYPPSAPQSPPANTAPSPNNGVVNNSIQPSFSPVALQPLPNFNGNQQPISSNFGIDAIKNTKRGIKKAIIAVIVLIIIGGGGYFAASKYIFKSVADYSQLVEYTDDSGYTILVPEKWHKLTPETADIDLVYADEIGGETLDKSMAVLMVGVYEDDTGTMQSKYASLDSIGKKTVLNSLWDNAEESLRTASPDITIESVDDSVIQHQGTNQPAILASLSGKLKKDESITTTIKILLIIDVNTGTMYMLDVEAHDKIWDNKDNQEAFDRIINEFRISDS